jgi:hypothetical protein
MMKYVQLIIICGILAVILLAYGAGSLTGLKNKVDTEYNNTYRTQLENWLKDHNITLIDMSMNILTTYELEQNGKWHMTLCKTGEHDSLVAVLNRSGMNEKDKSDSLAYLGDC